MRQGTHTIIKAVHQDQVEALRVRLRALGDEVQQEHDRRFRDTADLHFLSCCLLEQTEKRHGWCLVVELSFDGDVRRLVEGLVARRPELLDELFSACVGYPGVDAPPSSMIDYVLDGTPAQAVYLAAPGRSRRQIAEEMGLRQRVAALLDQTTPLAMSRSQRWDHVVAGIYKASPELRNVPKRPLRVRFNPADPAVRGRLTAASRLVIIALAWVGGVAAALWLARTPWQRGLVALPPLFFGIWAAAVFIHLSPRGLAMRMRARVCWQGILEGIRTAAYVAPVGGLVLAAGALQIARVAEVAFVTGGVLIGLATITLIVILVFSIFGGAATIASVLISAGLLWLFPGAIVWAFAVTVVVVLVLLFRFALTIRRLEIAGEVQDEQDNLDHLRTVTRREYQQFQTHLASETDIAAGTFRMRTLCAVLRWVNVLASFWFNLGHLDTITSIHFARFLVLPGRRTLLFLSNYDDRFEDYLGVFSTVTGVTAVWGNVVGFPRPFLLIFDGANAENHFKRYARASQVESLVWFSAYPSLSVAEIDHATYLRESLARPIDRRGTGVRAALSRLIHPTIDEQTLVYLMDGR